MIKSTVFFRKAYSLFLLFTIIYGATPVFAQKKTTQPASLAKCSGSWTGTITYTRTQSMTNNKTVERVSGRGEDKTSFEMKYDYKAQIAVIEAPEKNGSSVGRATINHSMTSTETVVATEKNSCDRGKSWQTMTGTSTSKTETTGTANGLEANVNVGVNSDGTYTVSVGLPQITGKVTGSQTSAFSGQCTAKEGKSLNLPPTETSIDGNSLTSDGTHRINPEDANRLSGSYSTTWQNVTETITWNLQKCGAPLRITDLKFEHMKFPNWNDWQEITEQTGTIDGNLVKIKAKVLNASGEAKFAEIYLKETYKGDKWDGAKPDMPLKDETFSVRLEPGEEREVEMLWDSSGYAWYDDGRPRLVQRIKAEVWEDYKKADEMTKNLKVAPKPVVLVHGLWSSWKVWEMWQNIFTTSHSYDWKAFPVGEVTNKGIINTGRDFLSPEETNSTAQNAEALKSYIKYAQEDRNAWHVDVVAHSIGGLISRYYISQMMPPAYDDGRPQIAHLVMLGTPNTGSPCADVMDFAFEMTGKSPKVMREMRQDTVAAFNKTNFNRKGVKFSSLAGNPLPTMCKQIEWNDGFVSVPSALWNISDNAQTKSLHTELTGTKAFSDFVKPHLAVGPHGDHNPEMPQIPNQTGENRSLNNAFFVNAAYRSEPSAVAGGSIVGENTALSTENPSATVDSSDRLRPDFAKSVKLAAKQSVEIEIPVEQAANFGLTFMADAQISATLFNDKGVMVGKNLAKSPEANNWFRSIFVEKGITAGTWKLKLENTSDKELETVVATWSNAGK
ncbi:MAG TPA: alpha/beta hydrolase [Pyrinomonadaceae bacterium]|jgi:pimeloyl-ACP methyl ester carboxylesterase